MGAAHRALNALGTDLDILPGGCTCAVQPVDNGVNKPLKDVAHRRFNEHEMTKFEEQGPRLPPLRQQVSHWIANFWSSSNISITLNC